MSKKYGVSSTGLIAPIIKEGDDITQIVCDTVLNAIDNIEDRDIIGITESVVARAQGNYVTVDEVAEDIRKKMGEPKNILVYFPIYSRNRFAMILKAIARAAKEEVCIVVSKRDYVGNVLNNHPFTGMNYDEYYSNIVNGEGKTCYVQKWNESSSGFDGWFRIYAGSIHDYDDSFKYLQESDTSLLEICQDKCDEGLLGSNKATEEKLKLFPSHKFAQEVVEGIQAYLYGKTGKKVEVMVYGDGCFKDPVGGIWEFADPVVSPAFTKGLIGTPNELKLKYLADNDFKDLSGEALTNAIKEKIKTKDANLVGQMDSQGTTPRRLTDLLGSLMDLTSGSGDRGTPIVYVKRYFNNLASD